MRSKPIDNTRYRGLLTRVVNRYNPEDDSGRVTWVDRSLVQVIGRLLDEVDELDQLLLETNVRITNLQDRVKALEGDKEEKRILDDYKRLREQVLSDYDQLREQP